MKKPLSAQILEHGMKALGLAAGTALSDPRGQEALARAVGLAQRGARLLGAVQEQALHAVGLAARPDYQELHKHLARLKRKARQLERHLGGAEEPEGEEQGRPRRGRRGGPR